MSKVRKRKKAKSVLTPYQRMRAEARRRYEIEEICDFRMAPDDPLELQIKVKWLGYHEKDNSWTLFDDMRINLVLREFIFEILKTNAEKRLLLMAEVKARNAKRKFSALCSSKTSAEIMCDEIGRFDHYEFLVVQAACLRGNPSSEIMEYLDILEYKNYFWMLEKYQKSRDEAFAKKIQEIERVDVTIENFEDFEALEEYIPISKNVIVNAAQSYIKKEFNGCSCKKCGVYSNCCPKLNDKRKKNPFSYRNKVCLKYWRNQIIECNEQCSCDDTCMNRLSQHPPEFRLCIFKTHNKGWGVRALDRIPKGRFISEYRGEVLEDKYDKDRIMKYVIGITDDYSIDARVYGSVARLVNHSCSPNAHMAKVNDCQQIETNNRVCMYAMVDIEVGEEITIDYIPATRAERKKKAKIVPPFIQKCFCGSKICRKVIY